MSRILIVTHQFVPHVSPRTTRWKLIVEELMSIGHEVTIVTGTQDDKKNNKPLQMIHKYHPNIKYFGDHVYIPGEEPKVKKIDGVMINYGQTKTSAEREETLSRRQRAWDLNITPRGHGYHYSVGHKRNWLWSKSECIDIRESEYLPYIKHLQQVCI